jgi:tetratricopeptide (TPR) repeat protein
LKSPRDPSAAAPTLWACAVLVLCAAGLAVRWSGVRRLDSAASFAAASRVDYFEFGRSLREIGVLGWSGRACAFRGPVYPALLSLIESYRPDRRPRMPAVEALMGALEAPLAATAALELFSPAAGLAAAAMTAFHPELGLSIPGCRIETLFGLLMCLVAWALIRWSRGPTWPATLLLAFAIGVSLLCRGVLFAFPLLLLAAVLGGVLPSPGRGKLWVLILLPYALLGPWVMRNAVQFGRFIPFEDHAATRNLYAASLGYVENSESAAYQDILAVERDPRGALAADPETHMFALTLRNIGAAPGAYALSCGRRCLYVFLLHPWLLLLALAGAVRRRTSPAARALSMLCLYYLLAHIPMTLEARYLEPLLPALMILAAGLVADHSAMSFSRSRPNPLSRAAPAFALLCLAALYGLSVERLAAEVLLTRIPCRLPQTPSAAYQCGLQLLSRGERETATARWRTALAALPAEAPLLRGKIESGLIQAAEAGTLAEAGSGCSNSAASRHPDDVQSVALRLQDGGRIAEALRLYDAILACNPDEPRYLSDRAVARTLGGREDLARADLRRALAFAPGDARASYNLGQLLEKRGRRKEALAVYTRARDLFHDPNRTAEKMPLMFLSMISLRIEELTGSVSTNQGSRQQPP